MNASLTNAQSLALEVAGREIAHGWIEIATEDDQPARDYDLSGEGDWQHVRAAAIEVGIPWEPDALQPDSEYASPVWSAALRGYLAALDEE
jgi:hypothetical protein